MQLSVPVIELWEGTLFLPLVGVIETARSGEDRRFLNPHKGRLPFLSARRSRHYRRSRLSLTVRPMVKVRTKARSTRKKELSINP
jgi:hypothetical protein